MRAHVSAESEATRRRPLLVTRFSLSDKSAIGAQTKLIAEDLPDFRHLHWEQYENGGLDPRSVRIENFLYARYSLLKRKSTATNVLSRLRLSWWDGNKLGAKGRAAVARLRDSTSLIYLAPIESRDAQRMLEIVDVLEGVPFVVHVWDFLDDNARTDVATQTLLRDARRVFCLNTNIADEVRTLRPDADILPFRRRPSPFQAQYRADGERSIALIGDIGSYREGVFLLLEALAELERRGLLFKIRYIGPPANLRQLGLDKHPRIEASGFVSARRRDEILASCDIGFLPGPTADPQTDLRSRFSIPSRVLDFLAAGLPIVGTLHEGSATFQLCKQHGLHEDLGGPTCSHIEAAIRWLQKREDWQNASERSRASFEEINSGAIDIDI